MPDDSYKVTDAFDPDQFLFHADASGAAGRINKIGGQTVNLVSPVHGQSSLPVIGGISRSRAEGSLARFAQFFQYGACETFAEGKVTSGGDNRSAEVTISASVENVRVLNRPAHGERHGVSAVEFQAGRVAVEMRSTYVRGAKSLFKIAEPAKDDMCIVLHRGDEVEWIPLRLTFNTGLLDSGADGYKEDFPRLRTPDGYVTSIVSSIRRGDEEIRGHALTEAGLGTVYFGEMIVTEYSRRLTMVRVKMGSLADGDFSCASAVPNGVWP